MAPRSCSGSLPRGCPCPSGLACVRRLLEVPGSAARQSGARRRGANFRHLGHQRPTGRLNADEVTCRCGGRRGASTHRMAWVRWIIALKSPASIRRAKSEHASSSSRSRRTLVPASFRRNVIRSPAATPGPPGQQVLREHCDPPGSRSGRFAPPVPGSASTKTRRASGCAPVRPRRGAVCELPAGGRAGPRLARRVRPIPHSIHPAS